MKDKTQSPLGLQDLCRKLKEQLESLTETIEVDPAVADEELRKRELMERLKRQLTELSF